MPSLRFRWQYTASNIDTKGIHEVAARRFVLVAADHPLISAISENADKLQVRFYPLPMPFAPCPPKHPVFCLVLTVCTPFAVRCAARRGLDDVRDRILCPRLPGFATMPLPANPTTHHRIRNRIHRPEGLVKISSELYDSVLPAVRAQVSSQIKERIFANHPRLPIAHAHRPRALNPVCRPNRFVTCRATRSRSSRPSTRAGATLARS